MARSSGTTQVLSVERENVLAGMPWYVRLLVDQSPCGFNAGDTNLYRYVGDNPTNATDPTGLFLIVTEDQKAKPIELFFGKDNVEYVPIPGKPGFFKVQLKPGAALHLQNYVKDADNNVKAYAAWLFTQASSNLRALTLEQLAEKWSQIIKAGLPRPMTDLEAKAQYLKERASNPSGGGFLQGQKPAKTPPTWDELTPEEKGRMRLLIYGKILSLPVTK
jgi:hypothetical protein